MDEEAMKRKFHAVKQGLAGLSEWVTDLSRNTEQRFNKLEERLGRVEKDVCEIKKNYVTKSEMKREFDRSMPASTTS